MKMKWKKRNVNDNDSVDDVSLSQVIFQNKKNVIAHVPINSYYVWLSP